MTTGRRRALSASTIIFLASLMWPIGSIAAAGNSVRSCQDTVAKAGAALVGKVIHAEQACLRKVARGKLPFGTRCVGNGGDVATIAVAPVRQALERAIETARAAIAARCGTIDLVGTRPNGLGMPPDCPAIHPSCAGALFDSDDAVACQICTHVSAAHYLLRVEHPGADATPDPNATPTIAPTPHPQGTTSVVSFEIGATKRIQAFMFHVLYPEAKGSFRGAGELVECVADSELGFFISNHQQFDEKFITLIASAGELGLPTTIACTFDVAKNQVLTPDDLTIVVDEVTFENAVGDPNDLHIDTAIVARTEPCLGGTAVLQAVVNGSYTDLAVTIGYPGSLVGLPGSGPVDPRVGGGPLLFGSRMSEDVDRDHDGTDDAVQILAASSRTEDGAIFEVHFDCLAPVVAADQASFTCEVDSAAIGGSTAAASCTVSRLGFPSSLP